VGTGLAHGNGHSRNPKENSGPGPKTLKGKELSRFWPKSKTLEIKTLTLKEEDLRLSGAFPAPKCQEPLDKDF
jgi:hypothetical protein